MQPEILNIRPHSHCVWQLKWLWRPSVHQGARKKFTNSNTGVMLENKENFIIFNVKIYIKLAGVTNKDGEEVHKKIQLRFAGSCRFMASSWDRLNSNLDDYQCKNIKMFYREDEVFKLMRLKVYIRMGIRTAGRDLMIQSYHRRMHFTVGRRSKASVITFMNMHNKFWILWNKRN